MGVDDRIDNDNQSHLDVKRIRTAFLVLPVRGFHPATGGQKGPFAPLTPDATPTPTLPLQGGGRSKGAGEGGSRSRNAAQFSIPHRCEKCEF